MRVLLVAAAFAVGIAAAAAAAAATPSDVPLLHQGSPWPQQRGPSPANTGRASPHQATSTPPQLWHVNVSRGGFFTTPTILPSGQVVLGGADKSLYCLDGSDGSVLWSFETGEVLDTAAAVVADGGLIVAAADGHVYKLDSRAGDVIWSFEAHYAEGKGQKQALMCDNDWLGWLSTRLLGQSAGPSSWFEGHPSVGPRGRILVGCDDFHLYCLSPEGEEEWAFWIGPLPTGTIWSAPLIRQDGSAVVATMDCFIYSIGPDGTCQWRTFLMAPSSSTPALDEGRGILFVGTWDGTVVALDDSSGALRWRVATNEHIYGSVAVDGDRVYVGSTNGLLYCLQADTGSTVWTLDAASPIRGSPALSADGKTLFVGSANGILLAVHTTSGRLRWSYDTKRAADGQDDRCSLNSSPALSFDAVVIPTQDGSVVSIPFTHCETNYASDPRCTIGGDDAQGVQRTVLTVVKPSGRFMEPADVVTVSTTPGGVVTVLLRPYDAQGHPLKAGRIGTSDVHINLVQSVQDAQSAPELPPLDVFTQPGGWINIRGRGGALFTPGVVHDLNVSVAYVDATGEWASVSQRIALHALSSKRQKTTDTMALRVGDVLVFRDIAPYQPPILASLNQIGFESVELLMKVVHVANDGSFVLWAVESESSLHGRQHTIIPSTPTVGVLRGSVSSDGGAFMLEGGEMVLVTGGPTLAVAALRIAGTLTSRDSPNNGLSLDPETVSFVARTSCLACVESVALAAWGYCDSSLQLHAIGSANVMQVERDAVQTRLGSEELPSRGPVVAGLFADVDAFGRRSVRVELDLGDAAGTFDAHAHVLALLIVDDESGTPVNVDYRKSTTVTWPSSSAPFVLVRLDLPWNVPSLPVAKYRCLVVLDLETLHSEPCDALDEALSANEFGTTPIVAACVLLFVYALLRPFADGKPSRPWWGRAWILTLQSSLVLSAASVPVAMHALREGFHSEVVWGDCSLSRAAVTFFLAYCVVDLALGVVDYRPSIGLLSGYVHHCGYALLCYYLLATRATNVLLLFMPLEISTIVLSAGYIKLALRCDLLFGLLFFVFRIQYHIACLWLVWPAAAGGPEVVPTGRTVAWCVGALALLMHVHWFSGWARNYFRIGPKQKSD